MTYIEEVNNKENTIDTTLYHTFEGTHFLRYKEYTMSSLEYYDLPCMPKLTSFGTLNEACIGLMSLEMDMKDNTELVLCLAEEEYIKGILKIRGELQYDKLKYKLERGNIVRWEIFPDKDYSSTAVSYVNLCAFESQVNETLKDQEAKKVHDWYCKKLWLIKRQSIFYKNFEELVQELLYASGNWEVKDNYHTNNVLVKVNGNSYLVLADKNANVVVPLFTEDQIEITEKGITYGQ